MDGRDRGGLCDGVNMSTAADPAGMAHPTGDPSRLVPPAVLQGKVGPCCGKGRVAVYLGHPAAAEGTGPLRRQKAEVDACHVARNAAGLTYYVDSGRRDGPPAYGHALIRLFRDVRGRAYDAVLVADARCFAEGPAMAERAAAALRDLVEVYEAAGHACAASVQRTR